jgi:mRNA-degrading endonuclease YafQ of YafQ-DinJ toxin-antitoxin module
MQYLYTARFLRSLKKCDGAVQEDVLQAVSLFEKGGSSATLKLHKLHGKFKSYHAFSANFSYRIIIKIEKSHVYYLDVGTHDIYQ